MMKDTEDTLILSKPPKNGNKTIYSRVRRFNQWEKKAPVFSVKYVIKGQEKYKIGSHTHLINTGEYLLVNQHQSYVCDFSSVEPVLGLCLYLSQELLSDIYANLAQTQNYLLENPDGTTLTKPDFNETVYSIREDVLGEYLIYLTHHTDLLSGEIALEEEEIYYQLAQRLFISQRQVQQHIQQIKATHKVTKKELFNRVNLVKRMLEEQSENQWNIPDMAKMAAMSEFHFFRTFKQVFQLSPHQYLLKTRLQKGKDLLLKQHYSVSEIAHLVGFSDIYTFSKAFKKQFGITPSAILHN